MRSPTGEVIFGGETMRFSNTKGRKKCTGFQIDIYLFFYTGWLLFMQKRQNGIGFPLHKEG